MRKRTLRRFRPRCDLLDGRCLLTGYTPAQITSAYGLNAISLTSSSGAKVTGDGSGQTIAIIETYHDPEIQASLNVFDARFGLPNITLNVINQAGNQTDPGWAGEESLDVEWAHAIAPGAAIDVVEAAPGNNDAQGFADLMQAIETASEIKGVSVVSMSLGGPEFSDESSTDSVFLTSGVTFVASSGDEGTVEWPATAPEVLAVGGTTLRISGTAYGSESGWAGTGGGLSVGETEPTYQDGVQSTGQRSTPDVSLIADPTTGVDIYYIPPNGNGAGNWGIVGGTSVGAPSWAGILAIANQGRELLGKPALTGATQTLPTIYALPASDFRKVSVNPGINFGTTNLAINTPSYNTQSGLGTPIGSLLIAGLVSSSSTGDPPPSAPPSPPTPPAQPPPPVIPPPYTIPTPIPAPIQVPPVTYTPAPVPVAAPRPSTPATPPAAAPPVAVVTKKRVRQTPKRHAKTGHLVAHHKALPKAKGAKKAAKKPESRS
jgi:subtilase family serine protease